MTDKIGFDDIPAPGAVNDIVWTLLSQQIRSGCIRTLRARSPAPPYPHTAGMLARRTEIAVAYYERKWGDLFRWIGASAEVDNYTYDLTSANKGHLSHFIAHVTRRGVDEIRSYIHELDDDETLKAHYAAIVGPLLGSVDLVFHPARRLGWYAAARALKPRVIVETGVCNGHGSLVLASALRRNAAEGHRGTYYGIDIAPDCGILFTPPYSDFGTILSGDSVEILGLFDQPIDLFINDSDHTFEHETREYQIIDAKLSPGALVLSDNASVTDALLRYAEATRRHFLFFKEEPLDHWYPGGGIGAAFAPA